MQSLKKTFVLTLIVGAFALMAPARESAAQAVNDATWKMRGQFGGSYSGRGYRRAWRQPSFDASSRDRSFSYEPRVEEPCPGTVEPAPAPAEARAPRVRRSYSYEPAPVFRSYSYGGRSSGPAYLRADNKMRQ